MNLFSEYSLGKLKLKNKIVMAPMTRCRAINNIPNDLMAEYYGQRAGAGLIISEGTSPSVSGIGYARIPGAYSPAQIEGWKTIAEKIHKNNGKFFVQLMHCGRISASENVPETGQTIAPSPIKAEGEMYTDTKGMVPHDQPLEMTKDLIELIKNEFVNASENLINAGIDGIELHAANGYLLNQFLNPRSNTREDEYGGDYKNRARFVVEIAKKVVDRIGADKVGIRLSPYGSMNDMESDFFDQIELYTYLAEELKKLNIAYIHLVDHQTFTDAPEFKTPIRKTIKHVFEGTVIAGGGVRSKKDAEDLLEMGFDLVYVGRPYISNPDLVEKFKNETELIPPKEALFYSTGAEGYTDY